MRVDAEAGTGAVWASRCTAGWRRNCATTTMTVPWSAPVATNVDAYPRDAMSDEISGMKSAVPPPNPAAMMPAASPRRSLNHLSADPIEQLYTNAAPAPAMQYIV